MAFKIWQIGLHLQQQEAVAVAIVRGAKECFLQRWWRLPLAHDIIKDGRIVDAQRLAKTLLPWSRELPQRHHIMLAFPASRTLQRSFPRPSMSLGEREQTAWLSGTMARELDMDPDSLRFDYSEDSLSPAYNVTAAQSKELATLLTLAERLRVHVSAITRMPVHYSDSCLFYLLISNVWPGVITNSGCGRRAIAGGANWRWG